MIRKTLFTVVSLGLTTLVLFGRDAASYVATTYHRLTSTVKESVPVDFQIDRAQAMVHDLEPEIRRSMHVIAKEEVAVEQLNTQIGTSDREGREGQGRHPASAGRPRPEQRRLSLRQPHVHADEVKQDLSRRFSRFKVSDDTLASLKSMRDAREKNLDAAQQKLSAMINARRKLEVDVENLEAKQQAGRSGPGLERLRVRRQPIGPRQGADHRHPHAARRRRQAGERRRERRSRDSARRDHADRHHRPGGRILPASVVSRSRKLVDDDGRCRRSS